MSQRKRATGFALMDTAFAADAKFLRLARKADGPTNFAAAVGVFWLILAEARRARSAVVDWDDYSEYAEQIALLKDAKLLTADGFDQVTFDRWAPAYRSPWDAARGTQGDATVPETTHATDTSDLLASTQLISDPVPSNGESVPRANGDEPDLDAFVFAIRVLGYAPNNEDFAREINELEDKYGVQATVQAEQDVYRAAVNDGRRLKPFDLVKETRTLLMTGRHREERELTAAEREAQRKARRERDAALLADVRRQQDDAFRLCKCGQRKGSAAHGANRDHDFEEKAA